MQEAHQAYLCDINVDMLWDLTLQKKPASSLQHLQSTTPGTHVD